MMGGVAPRTDRIELLLLRHADAGDPDAWEGPDAVRPLSAKGRRQADRVAAWLTRIEHRPDVILSSPKVRALETAEAIAQAFEMPVAQEARLAGPLDVPVLGEILADAGRPARPMLVGHDPDFSHLAAVLAGAPTLEIRKGALVRIDFEPPIEAGSGIVRWVVPPDALPGA